MPAFILPIPDPGPLPNPAPVTLISEEDADILAKTLKSAGEAIEQFLLHLESMPSITGRGLIEVFQTILSGGILDRTGDVFVRINKIAARLPIAQEAQALGLGAISNMSTIPGFKH